MTNPTDSLNGLIEDLLCDAWEAGGKQQAFCFKDALAKIIAAMGDAPKPQGGESAGLGSHRSSFTSPADHSEDMLDMVKAAPDVVERLNELATHLEGLDSGSGEAKLIREAIAAMGVPPSQPEGKCNGLSAPASDGGYGSSIPDGRGFRITDSALSSLTQSSEISDIELAERIGCDLLNALYPSIMHRSLGGMNKSIVLEVIKVLRPYLRTTEPVSVSLIACSHIIARMQNDSMPKDIAKAVLKEAGVSYVD